MAKYLLTIAALASSASAFAPVASVKSSTSLNEFANGYVGGEGPEPIPFSSQGSSVNWDPCGFAEVRIHHGRFERRQPNSMCPQSF